MTTDRIAAKETRKLRAVCEFTKLAGRPPSGWEALRMGASIGRGLSPERAARNEAERLGD